MTGSNGVGDGTPQGEEAVPGEESGGDAVSPFEDVDVEEGVEPGEEAPTGETLTDDEVADIEKQVAEITSANRDRAPGEQISVAPEDVS